jgi:hypothetical protein
MSDTQQKSNVNLAKAVRTMNTARNQLAPLVADTVINAVKSKNADSELLEVLGLISGQSLSAEELINALRESIRSHQK